MYEAEEDGSFFLFAGNIHGRLGCFLRSLVKRTQFRSLSTAVSVYYPSYKGESESSSIPRILLRSRSFSEAFIFNLIWQSQTAAQWQLLLSFYSKIAAKRLQNHV